MPLQLRRGTTSERLSIVPLPGEPIYDTDLDTIFIGNGITAGGISAITGITSEDAQDIVGQMFTNGQHDNLVFTYGSTQDAAGRIDARLDLSIYDGEISASGFRGSLSADDSGLIVDSATKNIFANNISANSITVDTFLVADIKGSIFADNSTLLVDAVSGTIPYAVLSGVPTALSDFANDLGFISVADISDGTVTIDVNNTGDLQGSVFADNSTILVDAINSAINLDGTVKGDIIPDANEAYDLGSNSNRFRDLYLSGTSLFLGSAQITAAGSVIELPAGSTVGGVPIGSGSGTGDGVVAGSNYNINIVGDDSSLIVDSNLKVFTGNLVGNVTGDIAGNVTGFHTGDVKGSVFADDSSILVDALSGTFTGNLIGNVLGNIFTSSIASEDSSAIVIGSPVVMNTILSIEDNLVVSGDAFADKFYGDIKTNSISSADSSGIFVDNFTTFRSRVNLEDDLYLNRGGTLILQSNEPLANIEVASHHNSDLSSSVIFRRSRGTEISPLSLQTNDRIHSINFNAFDGSNYIPAASIQARVTGTVSSGNVPTSLRFIVNDTVGDQVEALTIDEFASLKIYRSVSVTAADGITNFSNLRLFNHHTSGSDACNLQFTRGRGTSTSPLTVLTGDPIYDMTFLGYDGTTYSFAAGIRGLVDGTVSSGVVPGRIDFRIRNSAGSTTVSPQFSSVKAVFNTMLQLPTFADETAADTAIGGSGNRVNGMMYYDTALGAVRAVVGGSWTSL